ncbi:hypothetical protein [Acinetobacter sp. MB5]|uniref:hypothetical protein n=1 Tax=Acinetobacter sp. MB5 TaxID=2069438 RepID=UPI000DD0850D|nr:hypothetical protein [Acinetobacter sp. MB5]
MSNQFPADTILIRRVLLIGGSICLVVASGFLFLTDHHPLKRESVPVEEDVQPQFQAEKLSAIPDLGVLMDQVRPLQQTTRVVASDQHGLEFRGTHFVQTNLSNYSLELFETNKEEIINDFLDKRQDRSEFVYLRLSAEHQPDRYVLLYGLFAQEVQAQEQLQQLNLGLPKSIHPKIVQIKDYLDFVNDMGTEEASSQQLYAVQLKPVAIPRPQVVPPVSSSSVPAMSSPDSHAVQTTVTRRDNEGKVVSVIKSSGVEASESR